MSKLRLCRLETPFEGDTSASWEEYPRPQLRRDSYLSLCGEWQLSLLRKNTEEPVGTVRVPFPPESAASGIERTLRRGERWLYKRMFSVAEDFNRGRVLLHFGAVDQIARVWVNDSFVGEHTGGYIPFSFDITKAVQAGENRLRVEITDDLDKDLGYGKQRRKRGGMWYTPISGIWQPVWLESVPRKYVRSLKMTPELDRVTIEVCGGEEEKTLRISAPTGELLHKFSGDSVTVEIPQPVLWTPETPYLYEFTLTSGEDEVHSYFALRTVTIQQRGDRSYICLNGEPYFFHGVLDQGYFSDGIYLPYTPKGYEYDIKTMKSMGFNMLRKHIKIEPQLFYYYCDKYGMIVFQDMVNSGGYNFLVDTALPTIGLRRGITHHAGKRRRRQFLRECADTVSLLYNHPCVCYYTIFNEGWGQFCADMIFTAMKQLDDTRVWDATSGWFAERKSDVTSEHVYFKRIKLKARKDRPLVLSEFGGYSCKIEGHSFNLDKTYGYKTCASPEEFTTDFAALYREQIIPAIQGGLNAAVLTQLSDVEDETNGIVTYDRQVIKPDCEELQRLSRELCEEFGAALRK